MIMQKIKEVFLSAKKWWKNIVINEACGTLLMRWATIITSITLVVTTLIVIVKGVVSVCSRKK